MGLWRAVHSTSVSPTENETLLFDNMSLQDTISFEIPGYETGRVELIVGFADGQEETLTITRKKVFPNALDHPVWTVYLADPELPAFEGNPVSVSVNIPNQKSPVPISATVCSSQF